MCPKYFSYLCFIFYFVYGVCHAEVFNFYAFTCSNLFFLLFIAFVPCLEVSIQRLYKYSSMLSSRIFMFYFLHLSIWNLFEGDVFFSQLAS